MSDTIPHPRGNFLTGKLGPLPVWAWGAILGVGVLGFYLLRQRGSGATTPDDSTDGSALDAIGYDTVGLGMPAPDTSNANPNASGSASDNTAWINTATTAVAKQLTVSASAVNGVLSKYVYSGGTFTAQQQKWIDTAINLYGAPPQGTNGTATFSGSGGVSGGATGANAANPYQFVDTGKSVRIYNVNTGKGVPVAGKDLNGLRAYVANIGKGNSKPIAAAGVDINKYISQVS